MDRRGVEVRVTIALAVDLLDIALAVTVGKLSKWMRNYGIILVSAKKKAILKEDC